jgi:hypothetical protein
MLFIMLMFKMLMFLMTQLLSLLILHVGAKAKTLPFAPGLRHLAAPTEAR